MMRTTFTPPKLPNNRQLKRLFAAKKIPKSSVPMAADKWGIWYGSGEFPTLDHARDLRAGRVGFLPTTAFYCGQAPGTPINYEVVAVRAPKGFGGYRIAVGCRFFTEIQAIAHWNMNAENHYIFGLGPDDRCRARYMLKLIPKIREEAERRGWRAKPRSKTKRMPSDGSRFHGRKVPAKRRTTSGKAR